jgi:glycosyltransferase involved in cell wall biosynthesis
VASLENRDQFQLSIIGKGQLLDELILEAKSLGIERIVNFLGYIPHGHKLLSIFRNSDIFVLPAIQDQQPKVLMEAMAQGLPVIATDVGGIPSIITNGHNGLLVPRSQPEALAEAIQRLLIAKERIPIIKNGLSFVRKRTVEIETEKMMRIVRKHFLI